MAAVGCSLQQASEAEINKQLLLLFAKVHYRSIYIIATSLSYQDLLHFPVSEMTYSVSSGTLNSTIPSITFLLK